jgi:hypothetical protein
LTIKSTSYAWHPASSALRLSPENRFHRLPNTVDATFFALTFKLVFICPSNIQLSKISIASAINWAAPIHC